VYTRCVRSGDGTSRHCYQPKKTAGYARDTVRLVRASISTVLSEAVDDELIAANPALRLLAKSGGKEARRQKSEATERVRAMDSETQQTFLETLNSLSEGKPRKGHGWRQDSHAPIYSGLYVTLAKTGLRPSEAVVLLPIDIKFNRLTIRVTKAISDNLEPRDWTKTGLNRDVEISQELADGLRAHMATVRTFFEKRNHPVPPMLFPGEDGTYLDIHNVRRLFRQICAKAGIESFTLYDLRHTYASLALMRAAPPTASSCS
jgi:integrase